MQAEEVAAVAQMLPTREEVEEVRRARTKAEAAAAAAGAAALSRSSSLAGGVGALSRSSSVVSCSSPSPLPASPRLGPVEALFDALGRVQKLEQKMRALHFRWGGAPIGRLTMTG
jgi:hypothetical protein